MRLFPIAHALHRYNKFYEQLNGKTNFSLSPSSAKHESYVTIAQFEECERVNELPQKEKCDFVLATDECHERVALFDYMNFIFCTIDSPNFVPHYGGVLLLVLFLMYLFTILGNTADKFFCPALTVLSKVMGLSENLAGITLLAFGNGSPDIITAIVDYEGDTEMMYAELLGAAAFVIAIISGTIIVIKPFQLSSNNFTRDVLFFIFSCIYIFMFMGDQVVTVYEASGTILIYIVYLFYVIIEHIINKQRAKSAKGQLERRPTLELEQTLNKLTKATEFNIKDKDNQVMDSGGKRLSQIPGPTRNHEIFNKFLEDIYPINKEEWEEAGIPGKIFNIIKIPAMLVLNLIIPVVDYTIDRNGWSKLLNMLHCFTLPLLALFVTESFNVEVSSSIKLWMVVIIIGIFFSFIIFVTSRTDTAPRYHIIFAILAFFGSIMVIFIVANEVVSILETLGFITQLTHSMLGITVLSWGNSIGDLIANIALAKKGYQRMGFAACYGGPLFNTLIGMGATFLLKCMHNKKDGTAFARDGAMGNNCIFFLISILSFTLITMQLTKFQGRRSVGLIMWTIYIIFITFCALCEMEFIHPYGTDHRDEGDFVN